jgi:hypothetical protein
MDRTALLSDQQRGQLNQWLAESGELYLDLYLLRSGGGGIGFFVRANGTPVTLRKIDGEWKVAGVAGQK